jgi:hypothetical protein
MEYSTQTGLYIIDKDEMHAINETLNTRTEQEKRPRRKSKPKGTSAVDDGTIRTVVEPAENSGTERRSKRKRTAITYLTA